MPHSPELTRLRKIFDQAFDDKQSAYFDMRQATEHYDSLKAQLTANWKNISLAKNELTLALIEQKTSWKAFKKARGDLASKIDSLSKDAYSAKNDMDIAFARANEAYANGDKDTASFYFRESKNYQNTRNSLLAEKFRLIETKKSLLPPPDKYNECKRLHDELLEKHMALEIECKRAKSERNISIANFNKAKEYFEMTKADLDQALLIEYSKWHEELCKKCGEPFPVNSDWKHPSAYCKACKESFATYEKEVLAKHKAAKENPPPTKKD